MSLGALEKLTVLICAFAIGLVAYGVGKVGLFLSIGIGGLALLLVQSMLNYLNYAKFRPGNFVTRTVGRDS